MSEARHRGRRRYEAQPTHLDGEPAVGDVPGWRTRVDDDRVEAQTGTPGPSGTGEDAARARDPQDEARAAWFRSQRPPHWG